LEPRLPQFDPDAARRQAYLAENREVYDYDHTVVSPLPLYREIPWAERFTLEYLAKRTAAIAELPANLAAVKLATLLDPFDELQDYEDVFRLFDKPAIIQTWREDFMFAEQRLSGHEPLQIRRLSAKPDHLAVSEAQFQAVMGKGASLEAAIAEGRAFVTDYAILEGIPAGAYKGARKCLPAPIVLYCWRPDGQGSGELMPVAIQTGQRPTGENLFTPTGDPGDWLMAKLMAQIAHENVNWMSTHVCRSHFVMEAFVIATARQLAENHPLSILLRPHLQFLLGQDLLARKLFVNPGGYVDRLLGATLEGSLEISRRAYATWSLDQFAYPNELRNRGMDDVSSLPHYPYRDDGKLLWDAIVRYVDRYLALYYPQPADLAGDLELQGWARELAAESGGRVKGMPCPVSTREELTRAVSAVLWISGPQHSAINYPQWEYATFIPNMPMSGYGEPPARGRVDEHALLAFLPDQKQALKQLEIMDLLTAYKYDRLGHYDRPFDDPRAQEVVEDFQRALEAIEATIVARNASRRVAYHGLLPSKITNSISA
jgi:arachidonate 15-lipoxygenase